MAVGMHAAASGQLGSCWNDEDGTPEFEIARRPSSAQVADVVVLSEERSQEAAQILTERGYSRRPMAAVARYGRKLQCHDLPATEPSKRAHGTGGLQLQLDRGRQELMKCLPVLSWFPSLCRKSFRADVIAGLTVGIMVIPQSMSYASIAGLDYKYGMYSACVPTFVYAFFGQSRQLAVGPVAMVSLLINAGLNGILTEEECPASFANGELDLERPQHRVCPEQYAQLAILTSMVVGVMMILARVLRLGFLVSFLGHPVTSGFTSGAAIIIGCSQVKYILGYDVEKSEYFHETVWNIAAKLGEANGMTLVLGLVWLFFLIMCKRLSRRGGKLAILGPVSPLISCVVGTLLLWLWSPLVTEYKVAIVQDVPQGLFPVSLQHWHFGKIATVLPTALSACLIGYMESIAIGKNLAAKHGYDIDAGQELLALGFSNLVGAMFSCYPVTGSFSRSAVANSTGAVSQLAGLVTSLAMLCTLQFLTKLFYYMPKFALAAIVISSVIPLVAYSEAAKLWRIKKVDCGLWVVAFLGTLFLGVLRGILLAVVLSLVIVIYESVRPQITILWRIPGTTIYRNIKQESSGVFVPNVFIARIGSSIYFANAAFIKDVLLGFVEDLRDINTTEYIVLEMTPVISVDATAVHVLQDLVHDFRSRGIQVAFAMVGNRVEKTMRRASVTDFIGQQWFLPTVNQAVVACLQHQQVKRCQQAATGSRSTDEDLDLEVAGDAGDNPIVHMVLNGDEVGFSNDMHHLGTSIFVSLATDVPLIMTSFLMALHSKQLAILKTHYEVSGGGLEPGASSRFTFVVRNMKTGERLDGDEKAAVREVLQEVIRKSADAGSDNGGVFELNTTE